MKKLAQLPEDQKTVVIFRKDRSGAFKGMITAFFPYDIYRTDNYTCTCYVNPGGHSGADFPYCVTQTVLAKPEEYADLKKELERIGYILDVKQKMNWKQFDKAMKEANLGR